MGQPTLVTRNGRPVRNPDQAPSTNTVDLRRWPALMGGYRAEQPVHLAVDPVGKVEDIGAAVVATDPELDRPKAANLRSARMAYVVRRTLNWFCGHPRRRGRSIPLDLDDHTLRDIGFTRAEYRSLVMLGPAGIQGAGGGNEPNRRMHAG